MTIAKTCATQTLKQEHSLDISFCRAVRDVINNALYLIVIKKNGLNRNTFYAKNCTELCSQYSFLVVFPYDCLYGCAYRLRRVRCVNLLYLLRQVTKVVVGNVRPKWFMAYKIGKYTNNIDVLWVFLYIRTIKGVVPP